MTTNEREGGDITAADMVMPHSEPSQIQEFFDGATIFITGGTGFLGKLIIEKILRSCPGLKRCYMFIRPKKGKTEEQRFEEVFNNEVFSRLKRENARAIDKITLMYGDCVLPDLGLSEESKRILFTEVNCIFHVAATVRFDEKLRTATYINVRATRDLLRLAKDMKNLQSFVHVSTAFAYCVRKEIDEVFYEPTITDDKLLSVIESLDDDTLAKITPILIGQWPNTYVFTKAIAEDTVKKEGKNLPVAIVRPSIVMSTSKEPVAGWVDNMYGVTGITAGVAVGLIRTLHCDPEKVADMVPADFVINNTIAAAWDVAKRKNPGHNIEATSELSEAETENDITIYNYVVSPEKPIRWKEWKKLAEHQAPAVPSPRLIWHYFFFLNSNPWMHWLFLVFFQRVPAYIVDFIASCIGKKPIMVMGYKKIEKFMGVVSYFATRQWTFHNKNTRALWRKLNGEDRKLFPFDMSDFDWGEYFYTYVRGGRVYLLKDPLETIPQGRAKYIKLMIAHYVLVTVLSLLLLRLLLFFWKLII